MSLCIYYLSSVKVQTPISKLDRQWLIDIFTSLLFLFVFINLLFIVPLGLYFGDTAIIALVMKIFFGACISLISVIHKGITLYEELTPQEIE